MKHKSERRAIFNLLMCRDIDLNNLEGIIYDFACGLDPYLLNREPREFEFIRTLVDGSHWQSHRTRKSSKNVVECHIFPVQMAITSTYIKCIYHPIQTVKVGNKSMQKCKDLRVV